VPADVLRSRRYRPSPRSNAAVASARRCASAVPAPSSRPRRLDSGGARAACFPPPSSPHGWDERVRMNLKLKCTPGIYVVGFMASGKSTIAACWPKRLWVGTSFSSIDEEIEAAEGTAIAEIFDTRGEAEFRRIGNRDRPPPRPPDRAGKPPPLWRWRPARLSGRRTATSSERQWRHGVAGLPLRGGRAPRGAGFPPAAGARSPAVRRAL